MHGRGARGTPSLVPRAPLHTVSSLTRATVLVCPRILVMVCVRCETKYKDPLEGANRTLTSMRVRNDLQDISVRLLIDQFSQILIQFTARHRVR